MANSYDATDLTNRNLVRLLINDTDTTEGKFIFNDEEIDGFLTLEGSDVRLAAAQALDTIAVNEVLVQKRIKLLEIQTDGPAEAKALMARAEQLRDTVDADADFDWAEMVVDDFSARERIWKEQQRES